MFSPRSILLSSVMLLSLSLGLTTSAEAHCDTMNGPVIKAARLALDKGEVRIVLAWVPPEGEQEIRSAFESTMRVRALGADAKALADRHFFETLVRVHRAGEGMPYAGIREADTLPEEGIVSAERALEIGSVRDLGNLLSRDLKSKLEQAFHAVRAESRHSEVDVEAGRRYVEAYVAYIHLVERIHQLLGLAEGTRDTSTEEHAH